MTNITQNISKSNEISSRRIAELMNKEHFHVRRDIEQLNSIYKDNSLPVISERDYIDSRGQRYSEFWLNEKQSLSLTLGYSAEARVLMVEEWHKLKSRHPDLDSQILPTNYVEALKALVSAEEQKALNAPKVEFADNVAAKSDDLPISIFCKELVGRGLLFETEYDGQNLLMSWLREQGVLRKDYAGKNMPTVQFQKWLYSSESLGNDGRMHPTTFVKAQNKIDLTSYITRNIGHTPPTQIQLY